VLDSWLSGLAFVDTTGSVRIDHNAERVTAVNVDVTQHDTVTSGAEPFDFSVQGSQILLERVTAQGRGCSNQQSPNRQQRPQSEKEVIEEGTKISIYTHL
jgi:hypothetical protein